MSDEKLKAAWTKWEKQKDASPFIYYGYMKHVYTFTKLFIAQYKPLIYCIKDPNGEILAIAPLKKNIFKGQIKMLGDIQGCGMADFLFNPTIDEDKRTQCIEMFIEKMGSSAVLRRINSDSQLVKYLDEHCNIVSKKTTDLCVSLNLASTFDEHFSTLSSSVRQNVRTAYNRMKRDGRSLEMKIYDFSTKMPDECKKELMVLYMRRLFAKYKRYKGIKLWYERFVYQYAKHDTKSLFTQENQFHVILYIDGKMAGFMNCFKDYANTRIVVPRLAINEEFRFYSPGYIMLCETIKHLTEKTPIRILDLSRGNEKYKFDLGGQAYETMSLKIKQR
jgi:CelD/BcsL family acetyltransferase involved in cellulose biosynthesis